jgi:hypothetical protein
MPLWYFRLARQTKGQTLKVPPVTGVLIRALNMQIPDVLGTGSIASRFVENFVQPLP